MKELLQTRNKIIMPHFPSVWAWRKHMAQAYAQSLLRSGKYADDFGGLEALVLFVGFPRSGHSLVGTLLDAHPDIIIGHEVDMLDYVTSGLSKQQVLYLLLNRSITFTEEGREWTDYNYLVPNQWNGKFRKLRIIGDKKGQGTVWRLTENPQLPDQLRRDYTLPLKFVNVVRNPFDNITTMAKREGYPLDQAIEIYTTLTQNLDVIQQAQPEDDWFEMQHEEVIGTQAKCMQKLCAFVGVDAPDDYLTDCGSLIFAQPNKSRFSVAWSPEQREKVDTLIAATPALSGYRFES